MRGRPLPSAECRTLVAAAQGEVAHLPLDPSGIAPIAAGSGRLVEDLVQHPVMELFSTPRGNGAGGGHLAADNAHGVEEGQPVGILIATQRRFVHEAAPGEMRHQQTIELVPYQIRRFTVEHDMRAPQMSLGFVERGFDLPALVIERGQFGGLGENDAEESIPEGYFQTPTGWSHDGRFIAFSNATFSQVQNELKGDVWLVDMAGTARYFI